MSRLRLTPLAIALIIGFSVSALRLGGCRPLDLLDLRAFDYRLQRRGAQPASPEVVIVAVDNESIAEVGRWPWPRTLQARLLGRIAADEPAVIGVDIVQSEATAECSLDGLDGQLDDQCRSAVRDALRGAQSDDATLAAAVQASQRTVLGYFFNFEPDVAPTEPTAESSYAIVQRGPSSNLDRVERAKAATQNLPQFVTAARGLGYFNFFPDPDGIYRRAPLAIRFGDRMTLPLSLAMLQLYWPDRKPSIRFNQSGVESVRFGDVSVPVEEDGQLLINYRGKSKTFAVYPATDVLAGRVPAGRFRDKLVLVGVTATGAGGAGGAGDVRPTPFDPVFAGVEIHATVLDNILRESFIYRPRWIGSARAGLADVAVILPLVLLLHFLLDPLRGRAGALVAFAALALYLVGSQVLFAYTGATLSVIYPVLAIGLTYTAISVEHYAVADREKRRTRRMLELYLSPSLADYVSERPETLHGEKSERTVLFSDIKNFTPMAEGLEPEQLVELLNVYLGAMTDIVFAHDGMLDKYIGDGVMAVWGAPIPQADHAVRACQAALGMIARLGELNAQWATRGWPTLRIRIGLNSGPMVFGNIGSTGHLSLTVMGDNVNLGARLEGVNKLYGSTIIAAEATITLVRELVVARELDFVRVKGKAQISRIFEILGPAGSEAQWAESIRQFGAGLTAYRARDWQRAIEAFEGALRERGDDGPAEFYLRRCRDHVRTPPAPGWEPVTTFGEA
jgi:adenylate cyclase